MALPNPEMWDLRIGLNEVSAETKLYVDSLSKQRSSILIYESTSNKGKYSIMRNMFHDMLAPIQTKYIVWFDDDSYLKASTKKWLNDLEQVMTNSDACGQLMQVPLTGNQHLWIKVQSWYRGKLLTKGWPRTDSYYVSKFMAGGWWCIRKDVIAALDWPPSNIFHRGGDYMLGEALRQHDYKVTEYRRDVVINADFTDKDTSSPRRGLNPIPVGFDYEPPLYTIIHENTKDIDPVLLDYPGI